MNVRGLSWDEIAALPVGSRMRETITDTPSGDDHWAVYEKNDDGKWFIVELDTPEVLVALEALIEMTGGHAVSALSVEEMRWAVAAQANKQGVFTYELVERVADAA